MSIRLLFVTSKLYDNILDKINFGWSIEKFDSNNFLIDVVDICNRDISNLVKNYDIVIYYRLLYIDESTGVFEAKRRRIPTMYMIDDYLIDKKVIEFEQFYREVYKFMQQVDYIITSTSLLKDLFIKAGIKKNYYVNTHGLPIERVKPIKKEKSNSIFRVGWLGYVWHSHYEYMVEEILKVISNRRIQIVFICIGKSAVFQRNIKGMSYIKLEHHPFIDFTNEVAYYQNISDLNLDVVINVLPNDDLCKGKSELKYLETGLCGIPLITSNVGIWKVIVKEGRNGFLANNIFEFADKIQLLKTNTFIRNRVAQNAQKDILLNYDIKQKSLSFQQFLYNVYINTHKAR